ncbi:MAG TPA: hypothetical protein VFU88_21820 [Ktedonobacterales bacterium]|nr:hypothetical protein [Ktedonobacterales bacterium]
MLIALGLVLAAAGAGLSGALAPPAAAGGSRLAGPGPSAAQLTAPAPALAAGAALPPTCAAGSRTALHHQADVAADEWICGSLTVVGGDATVEGVVGGSVTVADGNAMIAGQVRGSVTVLGGNLDLLPGAVVGGSVTVVGGSLHRAPDSRVGGGVQTGVNLQSLTPGGLIGLNGPYSFPWSQLIFWGVAGAALALFFPRQLGRVRRAVRYRFAQSLVLGGVIWVLGALAGIVLFVTCLGIPLALMLGFALWVASVVGTVAVGLWLGERLLGAARRENGSPVAATILGVSMIALAKSVPCLGALVTALVAAVGVGAALLALREGRSLVRR